MAGSDPDRSGGAPDIYKLFCDYNAIYFGASLDACAVSWADDPLPDRDVSTCDYYPEGGGCVILLSKSLYECTNGFMKNVLLHEMIHAYICIKDGDNNHSDHGAKFQKVMNAINLSSIADPHRPVDGYSITTHHEIRKKYYDYKCESCGDLFKSSKMKGPSYDDCIEKIGADGLCQNLKCHWHRHKIWCSGSYHRVQESAPGSSELNHSEVDCSGLGSSSRDKSNKRIKLSKHVGIDLRTHGIVQEVPKRPRTPVFQNQECSRRKKRKSSNWDGTYTVVIEWLNYYSVSDSDEDEAPLINKRTERRKRQKIMEMSLAREFSDSVKFASSTFHSVNGTNDVDVGSRSPEPRNNSKFAIVPAPRPEERLLPNHAVTNHEVAGDQAAHEYVSSPLDSPIRGDIVDISDG